MGQELNILPSMGRKKQYRSPEGLIRHPHSECWYIKARIGGKLIYKSTRTSDLQKAELILSKVRVALLSLDDQVRQIIGKSIPFTELMRRYLKEVSSLKRSCESDTFRSKPLAAYFGDRRIDAITLQDVYQYQDWRKNQTRIHSQEKVSGPTVNREIALLRHAFRKAIRWGFVDRNPVVGIEGFEENKRTRYITDEEFEAIKSIARANESSRHLYDVVEALYHTAQRSGSILSLKWKQVNFDERTITFEPSSKNKGKPSAIWINDPLLKVLNRLKLARSLYPVISPFVFRKADGGRYRSINKAWKTACQKAKVKDARVHDIRHKAITDMVAAGYSLEFVGRIAGHSTPSTTHRYTHLSVDHTREALEALGRGK